MLNVGASQRRPFSTDAPGLLGRVARAIVAVGANEFRHVSSIERKKVTAKSKTVA